MTLPAERPAAPATASWQRALYVSIPDSDNKRSWSGTTFRMRECLKEAGYTVTCVDNLTTFTSPAARVKAAWSRLNGKKYVRDRTPFTLGRYARQIERRARALEYDFIFSSGSMPVALLRADKPIVCWGDATFGALLNFYADFSGLSPESELLGHRLEAMALHRASAVIYSSDWAAQSAIRLYGVDPAKVHVVPFGANLDANLTVADLDSLIARRIADPTLRLLFIAVEWERKGGPVVVEVARRLNEVGVPCELHIAGLTPPGSVPDFVKLHGFLDKNTPEGTEKLSALYRQSAFLILPSQADCSPMVFPEASAHALPSLATRVGGIATSVTPDINGLLVEPQTPPAEIVRLLLNLWNDPVAYDRLCRSAHREFSHRLNWHAASQALRQIIDRLNVGHSGT